ncbi:hypothetical protein BT69DRAFT_664265 [Atractiella rhizophila]|nr:hypothetical protein BT69DRAFT_497296 [Atractiella rhizophila]KAH8928002.1 hypothetical protein BT69DRAFT_664265 [Atractiella rhizophila]
MAERGACAISWRLIASQIVVVRFTFETSPSSTRYKQKRGLWIRGEQVNIASRISSIVHHNHHRNNTTSSPSDLRSKITTK